MDEKNYRDDYSHKIILDNREYASIDGVLHVESFDDQEIVLDTEMGVVTLKGEEMKIKQYDQEQGHLNIEGMIISVLYAPGNAKTRGRGRQKQGFFERILR